MTGHMLPLYTEELQLQALFRKEMLSNMEIILSTTPGKPMCCGTIESARCHVGRVPYQCKVSAKTWLIGKSLLLNSLLLYCNCN